MATYKIRTRNTDADQWDDRYEIDEPLGLVDVGLLTSPIVQKLVADGENQIECVEGMLDTRKFLIKAI